MLMLRYSKVIALCALALSFAMVSIARADDDMIDNPAYQAWAKFKPGTLVKYSTDTNAMGNSSSMKTTQTLTAITPDKATVQVKMSMVVAGNKMDMPAQPAQDIPAKIKKADSSANPSPATTAPDVSTEDVQAAGKTYSCKKTTVTSDQNGMKSTVTTWTCEDVPGSVVKMESEVTGTMTASTKMILTDFEPQ
jgi:hypothetical protein